MGQGPSNNPPRVIVTPKPKPKPKPTAPCTHEPNTCTCCTGLECLERPRYFAGMLLTDTELKTEQDYVRSKNRLHNRYLHGWGVVCGLQVVCNDCEGFVTVKSGYALDPCGNDIVVCSDQDVNFVQLIRACRDREERECDPMDMLGDKGCEDAEEHWCLTLCYDEQEARPVTTLRREKASCGCGCNGGGKRGGCGCDCHSSVTKMSTSVKTQSGTGLLTAPCEPTRTFERYRFGATLPPDDTCPSNDDDDVPTKPNTLVYQVECCTQAVLKLIAQAPKNLGQMPPQQAYTLCCQYRKSVQKFFADAALTRCNLLDELALIQCPPPQNTDNYFQMVETTLAEIKILLIKYLLDCFCLALLPPCAPDPVEDRLILACITVKGDRIVEICNFEGRRMVVTQPALEYWLTGFPQWRTIACLLKEICCADLSFFDRLLGRDTFKMADVNEPQAAEPASFSFGNAGMINNLFKGVVGQFMGADILNAAGYTASLYNTKPYVGLKVDTVLQRFDEAKIKYTIKPADTWTDTAVASGKAFAPTAVSLDQPVTLYTKGDLVVGIETSDRSETLRADIRNIRRDVDDLRRPKQPPTTDQPGTKAPNVNRASAKKRGKK